MGLAPRQKRNQPTTRELPAQRPTSSAAALQAAIEGAMSTSMADSAGRQAAAKAWMNAGLARPAPSGDRVPTLPSHPGHIGEVFGTGQSPAHTLLPEAQTNPRLPDPAPPAPPVTSSSTRPRPFAGLVFNWRPPPAAVPGPQTISKGTVTYVSADIAGGRGGLLGAIRRLFGRQ